MFSFFTRWRYGWISAAGTVLALAAQAQCTRVMQVPVSATGFSVIVQDEAISGIYPDILRSISQKEGCSFALTPVPRARQEALFESGKADLLIPATRTPRRDEFGHFVPLIYNRATLISIDARRPPIQSLQEFIHKTELRVILVRGFDYGPAYRQLVDELRRQGRLAWETDPLSVARMLKNGAADLTLMAPSIFAGAVQGDERVGDLMDRLRFEPVPELPWGDSGAYISKTAVSADDRQALQQLLEKATQSGAVWRGFQKYYSPMVLKESIRPR